MTALGKAPSLSRNKIDATLLLCHTCFTMYSRRCRESAIDLPGHPLKCVEGSNWYLSSRWESWSVMTAVSSLPVVLSSAIGVMQSA